MVAFIVDWEAAAACDLLTRAKNLPSAANDLSSSRY
jgi:hypothetical protein